MEKFKLENNSIFENKKPLPFIQELQKCEQNLWEQGK